MLAPPAVLGIVTLGPRSIRLQLDDFLEPGALTTITDLSSGLFIEAASLPGRSQHW